MDQEKINQLKSNFSGQVILPGEPDYAKASFTMVRTGTPAIVLRPQDAAGVAVAIKFARENSLVLSIKSGGHGMGGYGTNDGGLVIDLSLMKDLQIIDNDKRLVKIGAGNTWGEVAHFLSPHGLAISSGDTKTVGVGGLTVGGGVGWMVRQVGLAIDNLRAAEIVTADGQALSLSESENPELFWAIRGGGGNFGVIVSFTFEAHKTGKVFAGPIIYEFSDLENAMKRWRDCMRHAPEELNAMLLVMGPFAGRPPSLITLCCYAGDDESAAKAALDPLLKVGKVVQNHVTLKDYADVLEEAHPPGGVKVIVNNAIVNDFSDELITTIASTFTKETGPVLQIRSLGGAMNRVAPEATAFAHRNSEALIVCPTFVAPTAKEEEVEKALVNWKKISAFSKGSYVNFVTTENEKNLSDNYPADTLERLRKIKRQYDPENVFNRNFNIKP